VPAELTRSAVRIAVLAFAEVDDLDLMGAYSVLSKASLLDRTGQPDVPELEVRIAADQRQLRTSAGVRFSPHCGLDYAAHADAVVLPGGRGIVNQLSAQAYLDCLRACQQRGVRLYCVCSGVLLAAAAGLVTDRTLAIHAGKRAELTALTSCDCADGLIRDGLVTTVGGDRAPSVKSIDLALQLVRDLAGALIEPLTARTEVIQGRTLRVIDRAADGAAR
jgi:transcriptional regulator GlxA family with amidase domain